MLSLAAAGCQSPGDSATPEASQGASKQSNRAGAQTPDAKEKPIAYINSKPLVWSAIEKPLLEAGGGQVLLDEVLDQTITRRLSERGLKVEPADVAAEQRILTDSLHPDPDQAQRLLGELRARRGLGDGRYRRLLVRNAGLRKLIKDEVLVPEQALRLAFDAQYGARYETRLIVVDNEQQAADVVRTARGGASFTDLAIQRSTDSSRAQGGLLSPFSAADPTYPQAVRNAVTALQVGEITDPVSLERGYAVLKLERKIDGPAVKFDDVKEALQRGVRLDGERQHMQQTVRAILAETDVVVLDGAMQQSWNEQKKNLFQQ